MRQLVCGGQCGRQRRRLVARLCALSVALAAAAVCWLVYTGSVPDRQLQLPQWLQDQRRHERRMVSYDDIVSGHANFSLYASDVIVFLHVQKTGGAEFGRQLVQQLQLPRPCSCQRTGGKNRLRCACERPGGAAGDKWLFSSPSVGWPCGVHATWTELVSCVDRQLQLQLHNNSSSSGATGGAQPERRYFYVTWLRDPVQRVLSEWQHTRRGATWLGARHWCRGRSRAPPSCYPRPAAAAGVASNWVNVSLDEFLACDANLAHNRQTRMLADLGQVACYTGGGDARRDALLLDSARHNLRRMAFFGVTEQQRASQTLFERTFRLQFARPFRQRRADATRAALAATALTSRQLQLIRQRNRLDLQLYEHARQLMAQRVQSRVDRAEEVD